MTITEKESAFVNEDAASYSLSQMFTVTAASSNPTYMVLTVLDRDEYTAGVSGATGSLSGNGNTLDLSDIEGDGRGGGIVFTYQALTGRYYNSTYGYLDQITYNSSGSSADVTNLSLFGTNNLNLANAYGTDAYDMMQVDAAGYLGSATFVTQPNFIGTVPAQATPDSIAAVADGFVGQAWNMDGCWVLASTIAADAGASLPVQSTLIGLPGQANGEWIVAFNGPAGQSGNWESMVKAGEVVVIGTPGGGGHITTCVSGSGSTALLVDNITYVNGSGQIVNAANDGSSSDVIVAAPHLASQEWAGVQASSVVIYELDTPIVADKVTSDSVACLASETLGPLFSATDPANKAITAWQVYDSATTDMLALNGTDYEDHAAASALTTVSLAAITLVAGSTATTDVLDVRAYSGLYWGDWTTLSVTVTATTSAPPPATPEPPVVSAQTASQTWLGGETVVLALSASTFSDPQGEKLTYTATLANGQALPSWLRFNAAAETFTGTASGTAETLNIAVKATDTSGLSVTDDFSATVVGAPVVTAAIPRQTWIEDSTVSFTLPANTFTGPQDETQTYTATQADGQALPSWLTFDAVTETFSGTAPATAQTVGISVTATDSSGLAASENFTASVQAPVVAVRPGIAVTDPTPNQTWTDGEAVNLVLPSNTFTDALGVKMSFAAYEMSGPNLTSWLYFNPATDDIFGNVPARFSGTVQLAVIASDAQHVSAIDLFSVTFAAGSVHNAFAIEANPPGFAAAFYPTQPEGLMAVHT
ncbi:MAG TPA: putative Ig domain-containing protein [Rhodopila sp.]